MNQYQVKPVVVEATQVRPSDFTECPNDNHVPGVMYDPVREVARLPFGRWAQSGDWIVRLHGGKLLFMDNNEFHSIYEFHSI